MKKYLFLFISIIMLTSSIFGVTDKVLVSIAGQVDIVDQELIEILHISSEAIIARIERTKLLELSRAGIDLQILDSDAEDAKYYLVSHPNLIEVISSPDWGEVVYKEYSLQIIRNAEIPRDAILTAGYQVVELRPKQLRKEKILLPDMQRSSRDFIDDIIAELEQDSIAYIIQSLQDFETRYAFADNRDAVAAWIQNRYFEIGFEQAFLDSFFWNDVWHKNVIGVLPGTISPDEYIVIGGHHDSTNNYGNPMISAPGADDNASACAAVLELARVLKAMNYQPETTILFSTFAAEEVGLVGSFVMANAMSLAEMDVRVMINNDMIAHNTRPPGEWILDIPQYTGSEYLTDMGIYLMNEYTSLNYGNSSLNSAGSDSYSFWSFGYPVTYYFEDEFCPYYHSSLDIIENCDLAYCTEVVKLNAAMLLSIDAMPGLVENIEILDSGTGESLFLVWQANPEIDLAGYSISVGTSSGNYTDFYTTADTTFTLDGLIEGQEYFVGINAVDNDGNEGFIVENSGVSISIPRIPEDFRALPVLFAVLLEWTANTELDLAGYNVYRSETENGAQTLMNSNPISENHYLDDDVDLGQYYFYQISALDLDGNESEFSEMISSRAITLDSGILVIDNTMNGTGTYGNPTEEECDEFYQNVLSDFDFTEFDLEEATDLTTEELGIYSTVIWHVNSTSPSCDILERRNEIEQYLNHGGQLIISAFKPSQLFSDANSYPLEYQPEDFLFDYLKVQIIDYHTFARFYYADPQTTLQQVSVDTTKTLAGLGYHIFNVESIQPNNDGILLYNYGSNYPNTNPFGVMNGEPVGIGYFGVDFKTALFSFPFYYMNESEVEDLMTTLLIDYFGEELASSEPNEVISNATGLLQNYPNPFNPTTTITFQLNTETTENTEIVVFNLKGQKVKQLLNSQLAAGQHSVIWDGRDDSGKVTSSGLYFYQLKTENFSQTRKMLLLK